MKTRKILRPARVFPMARIRGSTGEGSAITAGAPSCTCSISSRDTLCLPHFGQLPSSPVEPGDFHGKSIAFCLHKIRSNILSFSALRRIRKRLRLTEPGGSSYVAREISGQSIVAEDRLFSCGTCPFFSPLQQDPFRSGPRLSSVPQSLSRHVPAGSVEFTRFRGSPFQVCLELDNLHGCDSESRSLGNEIYPPCSSTRFFK